MKKILVLTALAVIVGAPSVMAEGLQGEENGGRRGPPNPEKMIEKLLKHHDLNKDGVVSKKEFMKSSAERFAKMDANGDGEVTKVEVKKDFEARKAKRDERKEARDEAQQEE